jgi:2-polyprenyl-3-methyl-5-hydroxy-6-metoxy-1,4-benzoquinol methylase
MEHDHAHEDVTERFSQATWDARYGTGERIWSGNPNPRLVEHVTGIPVGTALDVGAGEGADAVWLAAHGWKVTALDVSPVALSHTRTHADESGVGDLVTTLRHDLMDGGPVPGEFDLVSAQFWHPPADRRVDFDTVIGAAVRPGGTLLVVGHHPDDFHTGARDPHGHAGYLFTPEDVVAVLPAERWDVRVADAPTRQVTRADGDQVTMTDSVVLAVRR